MLLISLYRIAFEEPNWVIYDGDGTKPSTNGTWLFVDNFHEITDGMTFKAAQTMFKVRVVDKVQPKKPQSNNKS